MAGPVVLPVPPDAGFVVEIEGDGDVASVVLDRPAARNAQTPHTWSALAALGTTLPATVRVVVVRGRGASFSAGLDRAMLTPGGVPGAPDLSVLAGGTAEQTGALIAGFQAAFGWLARPDLVSVALVQGHAIGAGFQLALACDLRILADDAQLSMAETLLGLVPDLGGTKRLLELVGYSLAADLCLTGRRVGAEEALRIGLASRVVKAGKLDAALADVLADLRRPVRAAQTETKALLLAAAGRSQSEQEAAEREAQYRRLRELAGLERES